ncbi:MAG TPA: NTP transferase domain-containing protein [Streptosporangiaceae bacterium]|nr:NTP transferase domain-containing protein [Streptosporangiaceae bacterium]
MSVTGASSAGRYEQIILAGGAAVRLAGRDKPALVVGGRSLLESVIAAGAGAARVIVVGPPRADITRALFVSEEPPGAGPVPALRRGLAEVSAPWIALLAADLPFLRAAHVGALLAAAREQGTGAVLADDAGRPQWLAGAWRTAAVRSALDEYQGSSLRGVLGPLRPALTHASGEPPPWLDCDTPEDLEAARRLVP